MHTACNGLMYLPPRYARVAFKNISKGGGAYCEIYNLTLWGP